MPNHPPTPLQKQLKRALKQLKPYLRWLILGGTLFFIAQTLKDHWQEVTHIQLSEQARYLLPTAFGITLAAHIWSGWVWHWILSSLQQPQTGWWTTPIYLKTNIAKYLPGNIWHFWGRIRALQQTGTATSTAVLAVVMEPLLMAVAALVLACLCGRQIIGANQSTRSYLIQIIVLAIALIIVHPRIFNPILQKLSQAKLSQAKLKQAKPNQAQTKQAQTKQAQTPEKSSQHQPPLLRSYPLKPLIGEIGFVSLRSLGFIAIIATFQPIITPQALLAHIPTLIAAFSLAWLLGLIVPGAPGGIGVFEATAIPLLSGQFPVAIVLSSVAIYRLISVLAEVSAAGIVWLIERGILRPV